MADNTLTAYKAKTDGQGNISEIQKIGDYIIPTWAESSSILRDIAGAVVEEIAKRGLTESDVIIIKYANQAICIPLSIATGTVSDMYYNNESFVQAIISSTGATAVGVFGAWLASFFVNPILAFAAGFVSTQLANYGYDKIWEWSEENGFLADLLYQIFGNKKHSGYAEKARNNLREGTRRIDPLVIDLDGDGIELTDINESNAMFDISGSGFANKVYNLTQRRVWV